MDDYIAGSASELLSKFLEDVYSGKVSVRDLDVITSILHQQYEDCKGRPEDQKRHIDDANRIYNDIVERNGKIEDLDEEFRTFMANLETEYAMDNLRDSASS